MNIRSKKRFVLLLFLGLLPLFGYGSTADNVEHSDSVKQACANEIAFIIDQIENTYISGRRGISDEEWEKRKNIVYEQLRHFF